ncbi:DgyrCDS8589 [Dimorphilus gyrociliatus]|uniref:Mitochondrial import inner membrane translocase subunit Tim21 n=1 Tax=Dimorphilus gyrociliatus TaxID=2664684 RepID=A0A7I8VWT0_9ANNE|nr:DgyrCDS8589 [Dimorphilus gyrociliatus]
MNSYRMCNLTRDILKQRKSLTNALLLRCMSNQLQKSSEQQLSNRMQKFKEANKTAAYGTVILVGLGLFGAIGYVLLKELFSSSSVQHLFNDALEKCRENYEVQRALGDPIIGYGERARRSELRGATHVEFEKDGVKHFQMVFYIKGSKATAKARLYMTKSTSDPYYVCRLLMVEPQTYGASAIVVERNA